MSGCVFFLFLHFFIYKLTGDIFFVLFSFDVAPSLRHFSSLHQPSVFVRPSSFIFALEDSIFVSPSGQANKKNTAAFQPREQQSDFSSVSFGNLAKHRFLFQWPLEVLHPKRNFCHSLQSKKKFSSSTD